MICDALRACWLMFIAFSDSEMTVVANRTYLTRYARGREQLMTCFQRAAAGHPDMMTNDRVNRLNVLVNTMATIRGMLAANYFYFISVRQKKVRTLII